MIDRATVWGPWATVLLGLAVGAGFVAAQTGLLLGALLWKYGAWAPVEASLERLGEEGTSLSLAILGGGLASFGLVVLAVRLRRGATVREYLALELPRARSVAVWVGAFCVFLGVMELLPRLLDREISPGLLGEAYQTTRPRALLWAAVVVGAPLFEEALFRGFLFRGLAATRVRAPGAVVLTAASFALIHLQYAPLEMGVVFVLGLLLGAARAESGSLVIPLLLHALNNVVAASQLDAASALALGAEPR